MLPHFGGEPPGLGEVGAADGHFDRLSRATVELQRLLPDEARTPANGGPRCRQDAAALGTIRISAVARSQVAHGLRLDRRQKHLLKATDLRADRLASVQSLECQLDEGLDDTDRCGG